MATLPPPPLDNALADKDGRASAPFSRWLSLLWESLRLGAWTAVALENTWANSGGVWGATQHRKTGATTVSLRGAIEKASTTYATAFTLPEGYRPRSQKRFPLVQPTATAGGYVDIYPGGQVAPAGFLANIPIHLDGITFETD